MRITIGKNDVGKRLDAIVRATLDDVPLSAVYKYIRQGMIFLNDKRCSPSTRVASGDTIQMQVEQIRTTNTQSTPSHLPYLLSKPNHSQPTLNSATILFDNRYYVALNKPSGVPVFGTDSLQEQVRRHLAHELAHDTSLRQWGVIFKPSALHRLDRNTSGAILFAKQVEAARAFAKQQKTGKISKHYIAIVHGIIKKPTVWNSLLQRDDSTKKTVKVVSRGASPANGRNATTKIKPLLWGDNITLIRCTITAGFTHQIRAQASIKQHPLIGDKKYYGYGKNYLLHCYALRCTSFPTEQLPSTIYAPLTNTVIAMLDELFSSTQIQQLLTRLYNSQPYRCD